MENEQNKIFIKKFNLEQHGFYNLTPFTDGSVGFSVKKKFDNKNDNATLLHIFISQNILNKIGVDRKPIDISAFYGKNTENGITRILVDKINFDDPVDVEFPKQYFYDIRTNELYEKNKKITADKLINDVYNKHIKSTRPIKGLFIRMKIRFWRILMKSMFDIISKFFHHLLFIISGNRYSYEPVLETETLNDLRFKKTEKPKMKEKLKEGKKFNFYGYEASQWSIVFYSLLHFLLYVYFMYSGYKPIFITTIFKNNFLVIIYAILSLWIIETVMQTFLMFLIKYFSRLSADSLYGAIKL